MLTANQALVQIVPNRGQQPEEVVLSFGYLAPPMITGNEQQRRLAAQKLKDIPVQPVVRISFSRQRLGELIEVLNQASENWDAANANDHD
jgi:hypothetical protein